MLIKHRVVMVYQFVINETISIEEAIRRVKAADNDSEFIHTLINDKMWKGVII